MNQIELQKTVKEEFLYMKMGFVPQEELDD